MEIVITSDGSHTLYLPEMDEHYHSVNGAMGESQHVYISAGFNYIKKEKINVFEVGFGTGLNAFLTLNEAKTKDKIVEYHSIEFHPVPEEIIKALNFPFFKDFETNSKDIFFRLHSAPWNKPVVIDKNFTLCKNLTDITKWIPVKKNILDVVYFDAFAPEKQPEVWNQEIFDRIFSAMVIGGVLTTYCAKGELKRMLKKAGFMVEALPGFSGKREMVRAKK